jgi:hypothetical protein
MREDEVFGSLQSMPSEQRHQAPYFVGRNREHFCLAVVGSLSLSDSAATTEMMP